MVASCCFYLCGICDALQHSEYLNYPGMGWLGHVGIATRQMMDSSGRSTPANQVIEILNESVIGQINTIDDFKRRSPYWGSKYGVIGNPEQGYKVLVEANHQRWWVREYTSNTDYRIAQGNPRTGEIFVTERWRCDTYAWWAFYSQGVDTMPGHVWLPRNLFNFFPYYLIIMMRDWLPTPSSHWPTL